MKKPTKLLLLIQVLLVLKLDLALKLCHLRLKALNALIQIDNQLIVVALI